MVYMYLKDQIEHGDSKFKLQSTRMAKHWWIIDTRKKLWVIVYISEFSLTYLQRQCCSQWSTHSCRKGGIPLWLLPSSARPEHLPHWYWSRGQPRQACYQRLRMTHCAPNHLHSNYSVQVHMLFFDYEIKQKYIVQNTASKLYWCYNWDLELKIRVLRNSNFSSSLKHTPVIISKTWTAVQVHVIQKKCLMNCILCQYNSRGRQSNIH